VRAQALVLPRAVDVLAERARREPRARRIELADDVALRGERRVRVVAVELVAAAPDR
jgi:hypothetical protein